MRSHLRGRWPRGRAAGLGILALVVLLAVVVPPPSAAARSPWTPRPASAGYTPRHVWQTRDNCVFASGQMLLDKWTHGRVRVSQGRLRKASADDEGGAGFRELARAVAKTTAIRLRWSPAGGDPMTWWQLLDRLEQGAGAVLFGEYGRLPAAYTRWAPGFAREAKDDHAVYIERYDRANGRVWLMDPLAVGGFRGEWIPVRTLRHFASFRGSLVMAAATTPRHRSATAPLSDQAYRLGAPVFAPAVVAATTTTVAVPMTVVDDFPAPAAHRLTGTWEQLDEAVAEVGRDDPIVLPGGTESTSVALSGRRPSGTVVSTSGPVRPSSSGFTFQLPTPERPGRYRLALGLVPVGARGGRPARSLAPVEVRVVGPFAGSITATAPGAAQVGATIKVGVTVADLGTLDWRPTPPAAPGPGRRAEIPPGRPAVLTITWRSADGKATDAAAVDVPLAPGKSARVELAVAAPSTPGAWTLVFDVVHPAAGSLAASGMAATPIAIDIDPPSTDAAP